MPRKSKKNRSVEKRENNQLVSSPKLKVEHRLMMYINAMHNYLSSLAIPKSDSLSTRIMSVPTTLSEAFKAYRRGMYTSFFNNVTEVRVKMRSTPFTLTSSVGGIMSTVVPFGWTSFANATDVSGVFDEYRFDGPGCVEYYPKSNTLQSRDLCVGVVDYDDASSLASTNGALSFDSAKVFALSAFYASSEPEKWLCRWPVHLKGIPDKSWYTTAVNYVPAWFKTYNFVDANQSSTNYGYILYTFELSLRQLE